MSPGADGARFTLVVRSASAERAWEAVLEGPGSDDRRVFSNPVDLALHLEAFGRSGGTAGRRGLR